jgi:membrane protein required for colicin V production
MMPIIDIIIAIALVASIIIGFVRGFVKEAISIVMLVVAIWASLRFGSDVGKFSDGWLNSVKMQTWLGGALVFVVILSAGSLLGFGISKLIRLTGLGCLDRMIGAVFGAIRGVLLASLFVIGGQISGFGEDDWWLESELLPRFEVVADWIKVMAPKGYELILPDEIADELSVQLPEES